MAGKGDKDEKRPIIKKVKKVSGHGHHGGAWKVAYADFVTAMMAFFLLLWLLSTTSKARLEGLAEYFTPTQGIQGQQGIGFQGGLTESAVGTAKANMSTPGIVTGRRPPGMTPGDPDMTPAPVQADQDANLFKQGATSIEQAMTQKPALQQYKDNISVTQTPEGLRIDIMDSDKYGMFEPGTAKLTVHGQTILTNIAPLLKKLPNFMSLTGHTDASPAETGRSDYTNWELSSDRAQSSRRYLIAVGMEPERPQKVIGMADHELLTPKEPRSSKNRRVSIVMLRGSHILIPDSAVPDKAEEAAPVAPVPAPAPAAAPAPAPAGH